MARLAFDDQDTTETVRNATAVSGVHVGTTRPAPYVEALDAAHALVGSIPRDQLVVDFQPIVQLQTRDTLGYEVFPSCRAEGLTDPEELFARAMFEKGVGELGRAIRALAIAACPGAALYLAVHPAELRDRFLVRPDDPICFHDAAIFLQLSQPTLTGVAMQMIHELGSRGEVGIVLDDFGVGPASLKQLVELAPRAVKLDRELAAGLDKSQRKQAVVRGLVGMCGQLGALLIAKGLDCDSELQAAIDCGVGLGQGFLLGEPTSTPAHMARKRRL
jgi:EAL domain-containing protein (putative c-di-GMP-specific phosphodiesterase class I)